MRPNSVIHGRPPTPFAAASEPLMDLSYGVVSPAAVDLACARKLTSGTVSK